MHRFRFPFIACLVCAAIVSMAACGGDDNKNETKSTTTLAKGQSTTSVPKFTGKGSKEFCGYAKELQSGLGSNNTNSPQAAAEQALKVLNGLDSRAPDEIAKDVKTFVDAYKQYFEVLKKANYDPTKADQNDLRVIADPAVQTAGARVVQYVGQVCGISQSTTTTAAK
jgi:hypothetical protein